jgi:hypothetical protein
LQFLGGCCAKLSGAGGHGVRRRCWAELSLQHGGAAARATRGTETLPPPLPSSGSRDVRRRLDPPRLVSCLNAAPWAFAIAASERNCCPARAHRKEEAVNLSPPSLSRRPPRLVLLDPEVTGQHIPMETELHASQQFLCISDELEVFVFHL